MTVQPPDTRRAAVLGDRRGLTAAGGVAVLLLLSLAGGAVDVVTGNGLREVFAVAFAVGSLLVAVGVHREDLVAAVVMPPLVYVSVVLVAGAAEGRTSAGSVLSRQAIEVVNALILGAPVLIGATAVALVVALVRSRR